LIVKRLDGSTILRCKKQDFLENIEKNKTNLEGANLEGADLEVADLRGADLGMSDLRMANLRMADLRGADLRGAYLEGADLEGADLRGADLEGAYLRRAYLEGAYLEGADLRGADLRRADLEVADLRGADLRGARLKDNIELIGNVNVMQLTGLYYPIVFFCDKEKVVIKIGCECHVVDEWKEFDDDQILIIGKDYYKAVAVWNMYRKIIFSIADEMRANYGSDKKDRR